MIRRGLVAVLTLAVLLAGVLLSYRPVTGPLRAGPVESASGEAGFVWQRSAERLHALAAESHFIGTEAHRAVQRYILDKASQNPGVHAELQTVEDSYRSWDPFAIGTATNIVARLPGTGGARSLLVVAHYDSVPTGPGAADDGTAVAAMLEVLRVMAHGPRQQNDLVFLFTDAEEVGSMGASGFLAVQTPEARARIAVVLNFDARGNRGPVFMFETSRDNGWLIEQYAIASPHPIGNSLTTTIYGMLKNDTDFSIFRDAGMSGLNFAYFDGLTAYHTSLESASAVDPHSIQHQGEQMLSLVQRLGSADLSHVASPPVIYFDVLGLFMVRYGQWLGWVLALGCGAGMVVLVTWGVRSGRLRWRRCGVALAASLGTVALTALLSWALWAAVLRLEPRYAQLPAETPYSEWYFVGLLVLTATLVAQSAHGLRRVMTPAELSVGALLPWTALAVLSALLLPGTSYFFQWPQLCGLGLLYVLLRADRQPAQPAAALVGANLLLVLPMVLIVPITHLLYAAFGMGGIAMVLGLWSLWLTLLAPFVRYVLGEALAWVTRLGFALGGFICLAAFVQRGFDPDHPLMDSLAYLLDTNQKRAFWVSADARLDDWTAPILGAGARQEQMEHYFPYVDWKVYAAETAVREYPAPGISVLADAREGAERRLSLRLLPRLDLSMLELQVSPAKLLGVEVAGKRYGRDKLESTWGRLVFQFWTPAPSGVDMTLTVAQDLPLTLRLSEVQYDSQITQRLYPSSRPRDKLPYPFGWFSDSVRITYTTQL